MNYDKPREQSHTITRELKHDLWQLKWATVICPVGYALSHKLFTVVGTLEVGEELGELVGLGSFWVKDTVIELLDLWNSWTFTQDVRCSLHSW